MDATAVDAYLAERLIVPDPALESALAANRAEGLPAIDVSPLLGKLLHLLARIHGAKRVLEVGTLGGYSTIWLARALPPEGRLVSLELEAKHAEVARENVARAGMGDRVEIRVGPAAETLSGVDGPFDLVFIDADKPNNSVYWQEAMRLIRPGGLIIVDNVVRDGKVVDAASEDPSVQGVRAMLDLIAAEPRVEATAIQTVGAKGYDGFLIALVAPA